MSANDDSDFDYYFQNQFVLPTGVTSSTVTVEFTPGSYGDMAGVTNVTQYASFTVYSGTAPAATASASLADPMNGSTVNDQSMDQRGYIDVNFNLPSGDTFAPGSPNGSEITVTFPSGSNAQLQAGIPSSSASRHTAIS